MVESTGTRVLPLELDRRYPVVVRGEGVWVEDADGRRYLDAMSGGTGAAIPGRRRRGPLIAALAPARRTGCAHYQRLPYTPPARAGAALAARCLARDTAG